jgi:hypothetical protein
VFRGSAFKARCLRRFNDELLCGGSIVDGGDDFAFAATEGAGLEVCAEDSFEQGGPIQSVRTGCALLAAWSQDGGPCFGVDFPGGVGAFLLGSLVSGSIPLVGSNFSRAWL